MELKHKTKGKFTRHAPCPKCGSSDALAVYRQEDGTYDASCFAIDCGYYTDNYGEPDTPDLPQGTGTVHQMMTPSMISTCPVLALTDRRIRQDVALRYGVRSILNGSDGRTPVAHCFPYVHPTSDVAYKKRSLQDKHYSIIGNGKNLPFFGQDIANTGTKKLYVTEGEYDALALYQILKDKAGRGYENIEPAVVSLPNGATSAVAAFSNNSSFVDLFQEIVLVFDQDDAGRKAVEQVCSLLPHDKVKVARFSEKDACDMLLANKETELKWAVVTEAKPYVPSGIATVDDLYDQAVNPPAVGRPWAWPSLSKLTYGRQPGIFLIGAGVGVGKTEFMKEQAAFVIREEKRPVGLFLLEESPARTLRTLAGKMIGKPTHIPDKPVPEDEYKAGLEALRTPTNLFYTFDHKWDRDWESIYNQIKHIAVVHGVRDIFIDPLTALVSRHENTDRALHALMDDIALLTQAPYNCCVYVSAHLNEPPRDQNSHEEGGRVKESQFAGSRAMIRYANYVIGLERNKQASDKTRRNTTTVRILKDREFGDATGETFDILYDLNTGKLQETSVTLEF
jgi:twinkle protein